MADFSLLASVDQFSIILIDPSGRITAWNAGAQRISGYPADEMIGQPYARLFDSPDQAQQLLAQAAEAGHVGREGWALRKDGTCYWYDGVITAVRNDDGTLRAYASAARDTTERRRKHELLRSAVDNTIDAIVIIDEVGIVQTFSRAGEVLFGYHAAEVVGQNVKMLMPAPYREEHDRYLNNYLQTGDAKIIGIGREVVAQRKDGSTFPANLAVTEFYIDEQRHFTGIFHDISEQRLLEDQLRQSQKMEAIGLLAGGVAHDFNNLLTVITGYGEMLRDTVGREHREAIGEICLAAERAAGLTQQLLAFSRRQVLQPKTINPNAILAEIEQLLRRVIGEDIVLNARLAPDVCLVRVDPAQLQQVVLNLAINARDAMPEGGNLTIETESVDLDEEYTKLHMQTRPGRHALLAVSDNGTGMTPEVKARIFEPFFTTKDAGRGTGLGLATVYGIVSQSGGRIEVYSELDHGTTFKIYLPEAQGTRSVETVLPKPAPKVAGNETVLLVEDEDAVRKLAALSLTAHGFVVQQAGSAVEALERIEQQSISFDILVSDMVMPKMSGRELADKLRQTRPDLKVLLLSGYTDEAVFRSGMLPRDTAFLRKPFTPSVLAGKVREVLDG